MKLEYRHNNGYDAVLLVGENGKVRSEWTVDREVLVSFCDCSQDAGDWDDQGRDELRPQDYGDLLAVRTGYGLEVIDSLRWARQIGFIAH